MQGIVVTVQGHAVAVAFFVEGGVRSCEIGELMFGGEDPLTGDERRPAGGLELCRMAIPRRVYTQVSRSDFSYSPPASQKKVLTSAKWQSLKESGQSVSRPAFCWHGTVGSCHIWRLLLKAEWHPEIL